MAFVSRCHIYHAEGRVYYEDSIGRYEYNIRDHLGNTRLTFTDKDGDGIIEISDDAEVSEVLQENHYYPFGMAMDGQWMANAGREDKYQYNGIERNEDFGLNWDMAEFRSYDAAIGRWMQVDPLAELAPEFTPYRNAFNNPISYLDPFGLFETRREARIHRREEGIEGRIKKQEDGSFAIVHKDSGGKIKTFDDNEFGVITEFTFAQKQFPGGTISASKSNFAENIKNNGFIGKVVYNLVDPWWVAAQDFNPLDTRITHLDNHLVSGTDREDALVNSVASFIPSARGTQATKAVIPEGLTLLSRLNAAQFSKLFKGTKVARAKPKVRGFLNRLLNKTSDNVNESIQTGNVVFTGVDLLNNSTNQKQ